MRKIHNHWYSIILVTILLTPAIAKNEDVEDSEKTKVYSKIFTVTNKDNLLIDNQFGFVKINTWDKNEVKVDVIIKIGSNSEKRTQCYLDGIEIIDKRIGNQLSVQTHMNTKDCNSWGNNSNELHIDYTVSMPKDMALTVRNKFGNTVIPTFRAPLIVDTKHGNFEAHTLSNAQNDITVAFGKVNIDQLENAKLNMSYSTLVLDRAKIILLNNRFGKLKLGEVDNLAGQFSYSGTSIGSINNVCKITLNFSEGFVVSQLPNSLESVDIQASYSTIKLPTENQNCSFDVTVNHGNFNYSSTRKVAFTQNDDEKPDDKERHKYRPRKQYIGRYGNGSGTKIRVVSHFGDVKLN
jgi:hypothetical protein